MAYLTPSTLPTQYTCRVLFIPDNEQCLANMRGLLETMTFPESFVSEGGLTPEQTASLYEKTFDDFCFNVGPCKMIGEIVLWSGAMNPLPDLWLDCDGASLSRSDYPALFDVIGTTYGAVDTAHFNLPDLRGRTVVNQGQGTGLSDRIIGDSLGEERELLDIAELPSHSHTDGGHAHTEITAVPSLTSISPGVPEPTAVPGLAFTGTGYANLSNTGGDESHNNMQPTLVMSYLIVAKDTA